MSTAPGESDLDAEPLVAKPDELDQLHDSIFGEMQLGAGKRYERLVAVIFSTLGEKIVRYDARKAGPGKRTKHQIDVWIERDGEPEHRIVECKHWSEEVGKDALDKLVGVWKQLAVDAALIVTTVGYTSGARDVAFDEGVTLMLATRFRDPEDWEGMVREIQLRGVIRTSSIEELVLRAADPDVLAELSEEEREFGPLLGEERFLDAKGNEVESVAELIETAPEAAGLGDHPRSLDLAPGRFFALPGGRLLEVGALEWTESVVEGRTEHRIGPPSDAQVLVREIDPESGEATSRQAIFDHQLRRTTIEEDGTVRTVAGARQ